jgi:hypothetical protein
MIAGLIIGAFIMLLGILVGYALHAGATRVSDEESVS